MHISLKSLLFVACTFASAQVLHSREWTSTAGTKLNADFVSLKQGKVTLKRDSDGKQLTLEVDKLSNADRTWLQENAPQKNDLKKGDKKFTDLLSGKWEYSKEGDLPFSIYAKNLEPGKTYPLVIGLHGKSAANKNGSQNWIINPLSRPQIYDQNPAILLAPLCYQPFGNTGMGWLSTPGEQTLDLIQKLMKHLPIDPNRIYLYGMSMGGGGTIHLLTEKPKLFAAGVVICGWANSKAAKTFKKLPVWAFHGAEDKVVPPSTVQKLAEKLKRTKTFRYTEFPGAGHNIFGQVMAEKELVPWLFSQKKQ